MSGIVDSELTDFEREALARAEAKFVRKRGEDNTFSLLPMLGEADIRGTWFTAYDNRNHDERIPELYRARSVLIYSEKNRFPYLCDQFMNNWSEALDEFVAAMIALERDPADLEAQLTAKSFGIDVAEDCYIVSFPTRNDAPIFATRELIFKFVAFGAECLRKLGPEAGVAYDHDRVARLIQEWEPLALPPLPQE